MAFGAHNLILINFLLTVFSVLISYVLAVSNGHVESILPSLSEIGDKPFESTIFTQCFVVISVLLSAIVQVRFLLLRHALESSSASPEALSMNVASLCLGHSSSMAMFLFACFQLNNAYYVHSVAGILFYLGFTLYFFTQTFTVEKLSSSADVSGFPFLTLKHVLNYSMLVFALMVFLGHYMRADGKSCKLLAVLGPFSQWILHSLFMAYFFTFYSEFKHVKFTKTRIIVLDAI